MRDERAGAAFRRGSEHQSGDVVALPQKVGDRLHRLAVADDDRALDLAFLVEGACGLEAHRLGAKPRFLLHRRLDGPPLDKFLRRNDGEDVDPAAGPSGAPGGVAQGDARLARLVDHHKIGSHRAPVFGRNAAPEAVPAQAPRGTRRGGGPCPAPADCCLGGSAPPIIGSLALPIELKMPALSPTMEEGTLAKWLVKEGDTVKSGDILAEIETDKATMEFEAVDEGTIAKILVPEGTDGVKVGQPIALLTGEGEQVGDASAPAPAPEAAPKPAMKEEPAIPAPESQQEEATPTPHVFETAARDLVADVAK